MFQGGWTPPTIQTVIKSYHEFTQFEINYNRWPTDRLSTFTVLTAYWRLETWLFLAKGSILWGVWFCEKRIPMMFSNLSKNHWNLKKKRGLPLYMKFLRSSNHLFLRTKSVFEIPCDGKASFDAHLLRSLHEAPHGSLVTPASRRTLGPTPLGAS